MKIVVIGGSGLIGSRLVARLRQRGHDVVAASPASGVDAVTGVGLTDAMSGAHTVVDVSNAPSSEDEAALRFFETSGHNLISAERAAGVTHHVVLSVVGTNRLQESSYFRGKLAQERIATASGIPYTIVRSTQFFEFASGIARASTNGRSVRLSPALVQPILSDDVAAALVDIALGEPANGTLELAGPDCMRLGEFVGQFLRAQHDDRTVVTDAQSRYFGVALEERTLLPGPDALLGATRFQDWLSTTASAAPR